MRVLEIKTDHALLVIECITWIGKNPITLVKADTTTGYEILT